jgi:hypothetical protein
MLVPTAQDRCDIDLCLPVLCVEKPSMLAMNHGRRCCTCLTCQSCFTVTRTSQRGQLGYEPRMEPGTRQLAHYHTSGDSGPIVSVGSCITYLYSYIFSWGPNPHPARQPDAVSAKALEFALVCCDQEPRETHYAECICVRVSEKTSQVVSISRQY